MAIMIPDLSGISQGMNVASSAIAQGLQQRAEKRLGSSKNAAKNKILQDADWSSQEGQNKFLSDWTAAGGDLKEGLAAMKQFKPSTLDDLLSQYGYGGQQSQPNAQQPKEQQNPVSEQDSHPATRETPFSGIPDDVLAMLSASDNPRDRDFGEQIAKTRDRAHKNYNEDRKYAHQRTKKFVDSVTDVRKTLPGERIALDDIKFGVRNREPGQETKDWIASNLGKWAAPLVSAEGNLIQSGVKQYLVHDLQKVKGRPNQFLEGLLLDSLVGLGKNRLSNEAFIAGMQLRHDIDDLMVNTFDELSAKYNDSDVLGFEPANFEQLVYDQMKPIVDEMFDKKAYEIRSIMEEEQGLDNLFKKKVGPDTPLTMEMMTMFADEYGLENAAKEAKKRGYTIPSIEQYNRYSK